jgi:hypothetical protein
VVLVDEFPVTTPRNITSWENHNLHLNVLDQDGMTFASWSMGGSRKTNYTVPARQLTNPIVMVTLTSNAPEATGSPVSPPKQKTTTSPVTAPVDVVESPKPIDSPIPAPAPVSTNSIDLGSTSFAVKSQNPLLNFSGIFVMVTILSYHVVVN